MKDLLSQKTYQNILEVLLEERRKRNPSYSLRAFARDLGVSGSRLSEILNGKQGLSLKYARKFSDILQFDEDESEYFCNLVVSSHSRRKLDRESAKRKIQEFKSAKTGKISEWIYPAVQSLSKLSSYQATPEWVSERLGISLEEAKEALCK